MSFRPIFSRNFLKVPIFRRLQRRIKCHLITKVTFPLLGGHPLQFEPWLRLNKLAVEGCFLFQPFELILERSNWKCQTCLEKINYMRTNCFQRLEIQNPIFLVKSSFQKICCSITKCSILTAKIMNIRLINVKTLFTVFSFFTWKSDLKHYFVKKSARRDWKLKFLSHPHLYLTFYFVNIIETISKKGKSSLISFASVSLKTPRVASGK